MTPQHWILPSDLPIFPKEACKSQDSAGRILGFTDREVRMVVLLNIQGNLNTIQPFTTNMYRSEFTKR